MDASRCDSTSVGRVGHFSKMFLKQVRKLRRSIRGKPQDCGSSKTEMSAENQNAVNEAIMARLTSNDSSHMTATFQVSGTVTYTSQNELNSSLDRLSIEIPCNTMCMKSCCGAIYRDRVLMHSPTFQYKDMSYRSPLYQTGAR